jgi:hypothetical protein
MSAVFVVIYIKLGKVSDYTTTLYKVDNFPVKTSTSITRYLN